ncbi:MAG: 3-oxoadipyl-CoA thiolase [Bacteroidetes bacterium]|nr:MAG: 3-oxoadipyl-CoA thiolase [Bacteroidota bacterium]REK05062.1 MAG: 3-oxoadipyl-CoA thiolase [Bacteroidota bacterium]REK35548.1 MAG: 3-oxoadipyl-CoA thiolase [Bacteroidota bacterium]REK51651.1 MAG: 3-oxoadipyl-CoA thiolase [Bacteroidota bacterium]
MSPAYIIDHIRTPIGSFGGSLASVRTDDLAIIVLKELINRNKGIDPARIADVIMGCANQAGEDNRNVARMALLLADLPLSVPGETVNRLCASGLSAAASASRMIMTGDADLMIAGGVENMTRGPWVISKTSTPYGRDAQMFDSSFGWRFVHPMMKEKFGTDAMGETAENLVDKHSISREDQDKFALHSQMKAAQAQKRGRFAKEIVPVMLPQKKGDPKKFDQDEFMKPDTTIEKLSSLKAAFRKEGSVTAGNSSGLNDGAAALLLASDKAIKDYSLKPLARVISSAAIGVAPRIMGIGPVEASHMALKKAGISMDQIDLIELNEAFAAQSLACIREWGLKDDDERINPNGGAIALGHPLGMSGARILGSAARDLHELNKKYALVTMCVGVGQGFAVVIERA